MYVCLYVCMYVCIIKSISSIRQSHLFLHFFKILKLFGRLEMSLQLSPVFTGCKLKDDLKPIEQKLALVNKQKVVYHFQHVQCDQCEAGYVGYTSRHLHQSVDKHAGKTAIGDHMWTHGSGISSLPKNLFIYLLFYLLIY